MPVWCAILLWIYQREKSKGGILVGAHNIHLQRYFARELDFQQSTMGQHLSLLLRSEEIVMIAGTNGHSIKPNDPPAKDSFQALLGCVGEQSFIVDLRDATTDPVASMALEVERPERTNTMYHPIKAGEAWDAILYFDRIQLDEMPSPSPISQPFTQLSPVDLEAFAGTFDVEGIVGFPVVLQISVENGRLVSNGLDSDGELFPMHRSELLRIGTSRFVWMDWPLELQFELDFTGIGMAVVVCERGKISGYRGLRRNG